MLGGGGGLRRSGYRELGTRLELVGGKVPVEVYVESTTEIVGNGIDHNVEYGCGEDSISTD